jgi:hypothetical protein
MRQATTKGKTGAPGVHKGHAKKRVLEDENEEQQQEFTDQQIQSDEEKQQQAPPQKKAAILKSLPVKPAPATPKATSAALRATMNKIQNKHIESETEKYRFQKTLSPEAMEKWRLVYTKSDSKHIDGFFSIVVEEGSKIPVKHWSATMQMRNGKLHGLGSPGLDKEKDTFESASYYMALTRGGPDRILKADPSIKVKQDEYWEMLKAAGERIMKLMWEHPEVQKTAKRRYIEAARKAVAAKQLGLDADDSKNANAINKAAAQLKEDNEFVQRAAFMKFMDGDNVRLPYKGKTDEAERLYVTEKVWSKDKDHPANQEGYIPPQDNPKPDPNDSATMTVYKRLTRKGLKYTRLKLYNYAGVEKTLPDNIDKQLIYPGAMVNILATFEPYSQVDGNYGFREKIGKGVYVLAQGDASESKPLAEGSIAGEDFDIPDVDNSHMEVDKADEWGAPHGEVNSNNQNKGSDDEDTPAPNQLQNKGVSKQYSSQDDLDEILADQT